jgi:PAS domain S-box-containing protein
MAERLLATWPARWFLVALAYYLTGYGGLALASWGSQVSLIWPPTGIALFAFLIWGPRMAPAIWLAALLINLHMGSSPAGALAIATGNTLGPLLGYLALRRLRVSQHLASARDVLLFVGLGAGAGMLVTATVGTTTLLLDGVLTTAVAGRVWATWWLGDALGVLVVCPALLALMRPSSSTSFPTSRAETLAAWAGLGIIMLLVGLSWPSLLSGLPPILTLPFVIWLALRQPPTHATWAVLGLAAVLVALTTSGMGPFSGPEQAAETSQLWAYLFVHALTSLLITAMRGETLRLLSETRASEVRLNAAERIARLGSWELELASGRLSWSPEIYRIFELDPAHFHPSYENFLAVIHPDDRDLVNQAFSESVTTRKPYAIRHRLLLPDGRIKHVQEQGHTVYDDAGQAIRSLGTVQDISELAAAELELANYRDHLEQLVSARTAEVAAAHRDLTEIQYAMDRVGIAIHWVDARSGRIVYVNDYACQMLGYSRTEFLALGIPDIDPNFPADRFDELTRGMRNADFARFESAERHQDGHLIPVEVTLYYRDRHDDIPLFIGFLTDISERRAAQQALIRAKEAAETANRSKSVFLSNMSHELRTPLNAILGFAQLMAHDISLSDEQRGNLATINRSGRHLLELINDVLEISRIESGRAAVQKAPFDLADNLRAIEEMTRVRADAKGLAFSVERIGVLPAFVQGDAPRLRQILLNLLGNAVKYTEHGSVRLTIAASADDRLRFEVSDTGPGIPGAEQERVFEAFYQTGLGEATGEGTGLGLAISREYCRMLGGELRLESHPDRGSRFYFELPLPAAAGQRTSSTTPSRVVGLRAGQAIPEVLIVEDNPDNRDLLQRLLRQVGFTTRVAVDGLEAVACCQDKLPDFIWMDMRMPGLDGYQATQRIRLLPGGSRVRIAALTASAFRENRADILAAGCDDMVAKPLDANLIFETMGRLLGIEYDYASAPDPAPRSSAEARPLAPIAEHLAASLRQAAEVLDVESARDLVNQLAGSDPTGASTLNDLIDDFRFDDLVALIDSTERQS